MRARPERLVRLHGRAYEGCVARPQGTTWSSVAGRVPGKGGGGTLVRRYQEIPRRGPRFVLHMGSVGVHRERYTNFTETGVHAQDDEIALTGWTEGRHCSRHSSFFLLLIVIPGCLAMSRRKRVLDLEPRDFSIPAKMLERARAETSPRKVRPKPVMAGQKRKRHIGNSKSKQTAQFDGDPLEDIGTWRCSEPIRAGVDCSAEPSAVNDEGCATDPSGPGLDHLLSPSLGACNLESTTTVPEPSPFYPDLDDDDDVNLELRRYAEAINTAAGRFDYVSGRLFIVQGWDSSRMQATVRTTKLISAFPLNSPQDSMVPSHIRDPWLQRALSSLYMPPGCVWKLHTPSLL